MYAKKIQEDNCFIEADLDRARLRLKASISAGNWDEAEDWNNLISNVTKRFNQPTVSKKGYFLHRNQLTFVDVRGWKAAIPDTVVNAMIKFIIRETNISHGFTIRQINHYLHRNNIRFTDEWVSHVVRAMKRMNLVAQNSNKHFYLGDKDTNRAVRAFKKALPKL